MKPGLFILAVLLLVGIVAAQERVDLAVAEQPPSNVSYSIASLLLDWEQGYVTVALRGVNGERKTCLYGPNSNPTASALMIGLNKANLSTAYTGAGTGSLAQRVLHRLEADGCLDGTVAGTVP